MSEQPKSPILKVLGVIGVLCVVGIVVGILAGNRDSGGSSSDRYDPNTGVVGDGTLSDPGTDEPASPPKTKPTVKFDGHGANVERAMFGKRWPLTVGSGRVNCMVLGSNHVAVVFTSNDDKRYALNGTAKSSGLGFLPIDPIWAPDPQNAGLKKDIGVLIDICAPLMP